jgi:hypothetical protein
MTDEEALKVWKFFGEGEKLWENIDHALGDIGYFLNYLRGPNKGVL